MGKKSEQIRKSKDDCYPIPGRIAIKYRISTAPSSEDGSRLVTIFYDEDGNIDEDKTYADWWLKEKKLGKYRSSNRASSSSSSSAKEFGLGAAVGGGVVGVAKWLFEETEEEKAQAAEDERIDEIVEYRMERFNHNLKKHFPLTGTTDELLARATDLLNQSDEFKLEESHPDELHQRLAEEKCESVSKHAVKMCKQIKKQDPERFNQPDVQEMLKRAGKRTAWGKVKTLLLVSGTIIAIVVLLLSIFA